MTGYPTGPDGRPGRDRKAVRHRAKPGRLRDDSGAHVVVVGGGIAGLAAATGLAERGVRVTLVEREQQLGGRVRAWPVGGPDGEQLSMSRGFHAFFRQYYNLRSLLRRADPRLDRLTPLGDYPLQAADGSSDSFAGLPLTPPLNLLAFMVRSDAFTLRELAKVDIDAGHELIAVDFPRTFRDYDGVSAAQFLDRLRFPAAARHLALTVFSRSFFADPDDFGAGELVAMFHAYFIGSSEGLLFDVPTDDFDQALWAPLGRYLARIGVEVRTGSEVTGIRTDGSGVVVGTRAGDGEARDVAGDAVVLATDLAGTQRLLAAGPNGDSSPGAGPIADTGWLDRLAALRPAPSFAVLRWWLDRPAAPERAAFLGTAGFEYVDNVSLLDRYEHAAAEWARRHGGSVVEVHAYALPDDAGDDDVRTAMRHVLDTVYPELAGAGIVHEEYLRRADCPLVGTGPWADRPGVRTPDPRIVLAGDGVRCDFPVALMERAATTGFQAANELLAERGLAGHDLWTVPMSSRYPVTRRRAARAAG